MDDVIEIARPQGYLDPSHTPEPQTTRPVKLAGDLFTVYEATTEGTTSEDVVATTGLSVSRVSAALAELELEGLVESSGGCWHRSQRRAVRAC